MILDRLEIVDKKGTVLFSYSSEDEIIIHNSSILGDKKGSGIVLMIKDYDCPNDEISLA